MKVGQQIQQVTEARVKVFRLIQLNAHDTQDAVEGQAAYPCGRSYKTVTTKKKKHGKAAVGIFSHRIKPGSLGLIQVYGDFL
jgi:hypothetical protein